MSFSSRIRDELVQSPIKPLCCRRAYLYGLIYDAAAEGETVTATFPVIKDDLIYMKESVTLGQLATLTDADYPTLTIKAYAIQRSADIEETATAQAAWALLQTVQ